MDCNAAQLALSARLDGELSPAEEQALQEHLARCPQCRALQDELSALHTLLNELEPPAVPPELKARVMANLPPQGKSGRKVITLHWKRWGAMAAAAAIVIAAAVWLRMPSPAQPNASVAEEAPSVASAEAQATKGVSSLNAGDEADFTVEGSGEDAQEIVDYGTQRQALPDELGRSDEKESALAISAETTKITGALSPSAEGSDPSSAEGERVFAGYGMTGFAAASGASDVTAAEAGQDEPYWNMAIAAKSAVMPDVAPASPDDDEVVEFLPESIAENKIVLRNEDLEKIAQFPDAFSGYLATLTIPSAPGRLLQGYYYMTREDGATLYRLPAAQFNALLAELEAGGAEFDLDTSEALPAAAYGLVIITVLIE